MDVSNQTNRDIVVPRPADRLPMTGDSRKFLSLTLFCVFFRTVKVVVVVVVVAEDSF